MKDFFINVRASWRATTAFKTLFNSVQVWESNKVSYSVIKKT